MTPCASSRLPPFFALICERKVFIPGSQAPESLGEISPLAVVHIHSYEFLRNPSRPVGGLGAKI